MEGQFWCPLAPIPIKIEVWLPAENWNGKFQAVGNGGWAGTISYPAMARALAHGYATASTDTGHATQGASFAMGQGLRSQWDIRRSWWISDIARYTK